jgi:pimeloyl-ACP methyl ester carboxylesterase
LELSLFGVIQSVIKKIGMDKYQDPVRNTIYYQLSGTGNPVMLVHGFGEDSAVWDNQVSHLKDSYQLIVPDLPGSGKSPIARDMSLEGQAELLKQLLDHLDISKTCMIGHSMGGYITLAFADKYPSRLNGFGLFHSTAYADSEEKKEVRKKGIEFIKKQGGFEFLKTSTPNLFSPLTKDQNPQLIEEQIMRLRNFSGEALVLYYHAMMQRPDRRDVLSKATVPVLFIMGEHDSAVPVKDVLEQSHLPEIAYIHTLRLSGHMGMLEEQDKSNRILERYLKEVYTKNNTDRSDQ